MSKLYRKNTLYLVLSVYLFITSRSIVYIAKASIKPFKLEHLTTEAKPTSTLCASCAPAMQIKTANSTLQGRLGVWAFIYLHGLGSAQFCCQAPTLLLSPPEAAPLLPSSRVPPQGSAGRASPQLAALHARCRAAFLCCQGGTRSPQPRVAPHPPAPALPAQGQR